MASKESKEGFLTEEQREIMKIASLNVENSVPAPSKILSSSPKGLASSPKLTSSNLSDHHARGGGGYKAPAVRHVRRSHSGKFIRVKKGEHFFVHGATLFLLILLLFRIAIDLLIWWVYGYFIFFIKNESLYCENVRIMLLYTCLYWFFVPFIVILAIQILDYDQQHYVICTI